MTRQFNVFISFEKESVVVYFNHKHNKMVYNLNKPFRPNYNVNAEITADKWYIFMYLYKKKQLQVIKFVTT